jgi:uncharacterized protein (TIGR02147 family)
MGKNIFEFNEYKAYLGSRIQAMPKAGRGFRVEMAEAIQCQKPFVSQVLKGEAQFSLEQAERLNKLLEHDPEQAHYFLLLVQIARAGTASLREFFQSQLDSIKEHRLTLRNRLRSDSVISEESKSKYYSSWIYGAIRVALTIPGLRTRKALAKTFALPEEVLQEALQFLEESGLIEKQNELYQATALNLHLGNDSSLIARHHTNWRLKALEAVSRAKPSDLHFSGVVSLSTKDVTKIRSVLVDAIERSKEIVKDSPEETLYVICADFFGF